jgi:hypothetical protein
MKKLLMVLFFVLCASLVYSADQTITFEWDIANPPVTGYNLYSAEVETGPWTRLNDKMISGDLTTWAYTYTDAIEAPRWYMIKATDGRNESDPSNIVNCVIDTIPPNPIGGLNLSSD